MKNVYLPAVEKFRADFFGIIKEGIAIIKEKRGCVQPPDTTWATKVGEEEITSQWSVSNPSPLAPEHTCGQEPAVGHVYISLPDGRPFTIGIEQKDLEVEPTIEDHKDVLDQLLDYMSAGAVQEWMNRNLGYMVREAITNKDFAKLEEISRGRITCDFGDHHVHLVYKDREDQIQYKIDVDDPRELFFGEQVIPRDFFFRSYMIALHQGIMHGELYKNVPMHLGSFPIAPEGITEE